MSTPVEEPWSPEPELRDPTPRRVQPSEFPDLNAPNVTVYNAAGGVLIALGVVLLVLGIAGRGVVFILLGVVLGAVGGFALTMPARKAAQVKERAERLVRNGQPIMARIVTAENLTGDSVHGRSVSYMVTLPGGEVVRREVNADDRTLPKRIPGNVTALIDPANTNDVELYCALPFRAVSRIPVAAAAAAADPLADLPTATPSGTGTMGTVEGNKPQDSPPPQQQSQQQGSPKKSDYQGLPWE
jgi:hypothetical protein